MAETNCSTVVEFILLGFSDLASLQGILFGIFFFIYTSILVGNGLIIVITKVTAALQTPMYFFLRNFSFLEICYTSVTIPRMLSDLWTQKKNISFLACGIQLAVLLSLGGTESFFLAVMAYDRYVAICKPLYYPVIMNHKKCLQLVTGAWLIGIPIQVAQTCQLFSQSFCESNELNHVFCDIPPLLKLARGDTSLNELSVYAGATIFVTIPSLLILWSYIKIIKTILKLPSAMGRSKAFSTCSSHLIVVGLFYGSGFITYLRPKSNHSPGVDKVLALFYTIVTPLFNPMIYSLRNKDVIAAIKQLVPKCLS
ncbi:olfactory receptor 10AG1-like [Vombatus ursinus]|uniref:olfactory receptor 10AG1-like n=1 Tax=Vombatus ursinus TaxID=29139 RepID=UPI000FFD5975|nr:olfactory receptor 10AG1-like [Vombatus ursinus]